jgi:hypothetical protein
VSHLDDRHISPVAWEWQDRVFGVLHLQLEPPITLRSYLKRRYRQELGTAPDVLGSNPGRETGYPYWGFSKFLNPCRKNTGMISASIRQRPFPSESFPIHLDAYHSIL